MYLQQNSHVRKLVNAIITGLTIVNGVDEGVVWFKEVSSVDVEGGALVDVVGVVTSEVLVDVVGVVTSEVLLSESEGIIPSVMTEQMFP